MDMGRGPKNCEKIAKNCEKLRKNCEKLRWFSNRKSEMDLANFFGFRHPEKIMRLCPWENPMKTQLEKNLHTIQSTMRLAWTIGKHSSGHRRRMQCAFANSPLVSVPHHCYHQSYGARSKPEKHLHGTDHIKDAPQGHRCIAT